MGIEELDEVLVLKIFLVADRSLVLSLSGYVFHCVGHSLKFGGIEESGLPDAGIESLT